MDMASSRHASPSRAAPSSVAASHLRSLCLPWPTRVVTYSSSWVWTVLPAVVSWARRRTAAEAMCRAVGVPLEAGLGGRGLGLSGLRDVSCSRAPSMACCMVPEAWYSSVVSSSSGWLKQFALHFPELSQQVFLLLAGGCSVARCGGGSVCGRARSARVRVLHKGRVVCVGFIAPVSSGCWVAARGGDGGGAVGGGCGIVAGVWSWWLACVLEHGIGVWFC